MFPFCFLASIFRALLFLLGSVRDFWTARAPTREEVAKDLALLEALDPVVQSLEGEADADAVRAYYEHTTYRDYRLLAWLGGDEVMHTPLARDGPLASPFLESALLVLSRVRAGAAVLELGCGKGANALFLRTVSPSTRVVGVDLTPAHVRHARLRAADLGCGDVTFLAGDAAALADVPVSGPFDTVFAIESLCHLSRDGVRSLMAWAAEHLQPGGELVVLDGFKGEEGAKDEAARACAELAERGFRLPGMLSMAEWRRFGERAGFQVVVQDRLTREALPFWSRWWRLARLLLRVPFAIRAYAASGEARRRETLANFAAVVGTAPSLALGSTEYGMLVFKNISAKSMAGSG